MASSILRALSVDFGETHGVMKRDLLTILKNANSKDSNKVAEELEEFEALFKQYLVDRKAESSTVTWDKIQALPDSAVMPYASIQKTDLSSSKELLDKLVVVKLNGGLGTSMGCQGPKSLISVRNDQTFLDLSVRQIENLNSKYKSNVPLVLMNSFYTHEDTLKIKPKYERRVPLYMFMQSCYPRIERETLRPLADSPYSDKQCWYPPGHGDIYRSLMHSGLMDKFIEQGREYIFISNIDNLGATVDLNILNFIVQSMADSKKHCEFAMEVTDKTRADVKGGTLIHYEDRLRLLEIAQVPKDKIDEFKSISKFKIFNTNNLWVSLKAIKRLLEEDKLEMEVIVNPKTLENGTNVIQLENAAGAAIKNFNGAMGINVPRSRFLPVKKTSDLLIVMSNLYQIQPDGSLVMNPGRSYPSVPLVKLGDIHFSKVKDFLRRFDSIPDMLELDHLTVSGDVTMGKNVSLKGTVIIIANHGDRIDIPSGSVLENKIVSGNLRILEH